MTFASTKCPGSAVSFLCTVWGRALEALAFSMFVKGKNTAFNQSINIIEFAEKWVWYGFQFSVQTIFWVSLSISLHFFSKALPPVYD